MPRLLISTPDGQTKRGNVDSSSLIAELATRLGLERDCCLTLAGVPLEAERTVGEYGVTDGMEFEVEKLTGPTTLAAMAKIRPQRPIQSDEEPVRQPVVEPGIADLIAAARQGDLETVVGTIQSGAVGINQFCQVSSLNPASAAASGGQTEVLKWLLQSGANPNKCEFNQLPPIHAAASSGSTQCATILIKARADLEAVEDMLGQTALHAAIERSQPGMVEFLIQQGLELNTPNMNGVTPLACAAAKPDLECVRLLLEYRCTVMTENNCGVSPLAAAVHRESVSVVRLLLEGGAAVDGSSLFNSANSQSQEIQDLVLDYGAGPESANLDGRTALHVAAAAGSTEICSYLLDQHANVDTCCTAARTPLMEAARGGHKGVTRLLLSWEANVDARDIDGNSALHAAGWYEKPKVFDILVKVGGADPEATNKKGDKPRSPNPGEKCVIM
eukprot:TRINITY_DN8335_c0_g2_i1.p1 TRINITY_DN8335_c0_g2~~TRINITY_DN8335_c0_g2_i1.p1  ORF type:complete len:445 (+),score=95.54 TRINITY_DN8335_c0_g2_i1:304-1638(+)